MKEKWPGRCTAEQDAIELTDKTVCWAVRRSARHYAVYHLSVGMTLFNMDYEVSLGPDRKSS